MSLNWEEVDSGICRAKIFGGWLVQSNEDVFVVRGDPCYNLPESGYITVSN